MSSWSFSCLWKSITGLIIALLNMREKKNSNKNQLVFVTGCDSGLGYNMAIKCHSLGMTVLAGVLNLSSEGALKLRDMFLMDCFHMIAIDISKTESIIDALKEVNNILQKHKEMKFYSLINNAGIMSFGEFEWQTPRIIENQIYVNLLGTMKLTHQFLPLIRKHESRIITVTSHCGLHSLPGLSSYSASKAGLCSWSEALRIEMKKYNVNVVNFIPGSFVSFSNIASQQQESANEMRLSFSSEQLRFYGDYFERYNDYLKLIPLSKSPQEIKNNKLLTQFELALLENNPKNIYKYEPLRYTFYHTLFRITPIFIHDWLVKKFISMPEYDSTQKN